MGFPGGSEFKESVWNAGDLGSNPELGRSPGAGNVKIWSFCKVKRQPSDWEKLIANEATKTKD